MTTGSLIEYLVNGLQAGLLLFVISAGLTLSFGLMRVVNLAHGSFYMLGAFAGLTAAKLSGSFILGAIVAAVAAAVAGWLIERALFRRLYPRGPFAQMLVSFGLIFVFDELVRIVWGGEIRSLPRPDLLSDSYEWLGASIEGYRLFLIAFGVVVCAGLFAGLVRTPIGTAVRAAVDDREASELLGMKVTALFSLVFLIGAGLAGVAGYVAIPIVNAFPGMGDDVLVSCLVVVVIGGLGSVLGSLLASILIGYALTVGQVLVAGYAPAVMYGVLTLVLLLRPHGLLGKAEGA
ncbi:branched-chain amino acid ABC transporter permease [Variovorax sp. J22P168]|uniref:branched-chain amino acid ABC transporter permease n=1 Tax=Variovorax jilinensis TaxID=3053513 RepID=UPI002577C441|nr:branched-chain amino acid ABC transporter permease [Variovorax sp. J22P168]MDM0015199.1 branched-chain amino acid ABC transporter permease [Variovorax sp. J22P168]